MSQYGMLKQIYPYLPYCLIRSLLSVAISKKVFMYQSAVHFPTNGVALRSEEKFENMAADQIKMLLKQCGRYG